jgi:transcriptional regulator with XRE-family HTH domain
MIKVKKEKFVMTMKSLTPIARQLAEARQTSKMSVLELADRTGYGESLIQKLECGQRKPSFSSLLAWTEALGYDLTVTRKSHE